MFRVAVVNTRQSKRVERCEIRVAEVLVVLADFSSFSVQFFCNKNTNKILIKMARIVAIKETLEKSLHDERKPWAKYLALAEQKSGVNRLYLFLGIFLGYNSHIFVL